MPTCILGDPANPFTPFPYEGVCEWRKKQRRAVFWFETFIYKIGNLCAFGRLRGRFGCCLRSVTVIDIKYLPEVIHACFILHSYCDIKNDLSYDPYGPARAFIAKPLRKSPYEGRTRWREQGRKKPSGPARIAYGPARIAYGSSRDAN